MTKILVFDKDKERAQELRNFIKGTLLKLKCGFELSTYTSIESIIPIIDDNPYEYDVLFLNTSDLNNALQIASVVRKQNLTCSIMFTGLKYDSLLSTLIYRPSAFFLFPLNYQRLDKYLNFAVKEQSRFNQYFYIRSKEKITRIPYKKIELFQSHQRSIILFETGVNRQYVFNGKLDDVHKLLPKGNFIRCHQSYIVNLDNVNVLDKTNKQFILNSGKIVDISKRQYAEVIQYFDSLFIQNGTLGKEILTTMTS